MAHASAAVLSKPFVDENFRFYGTALTGAKELRPRWKRCVQYTDNDLGEALGQAFVKETFGAQAKADTLKMVHELEAALQTDINGLSLDDAGDQEGSARQAARHRRQDRLSRSLARLQRADHRRAATRSATRSAATPSSSTAR